MALTEPTQPPENVRRSSPLDARNLDGHTIEELSDYLDRGRRPRNPAIESSAGTQNALAALSRLRAVAPKILEAEARAKPARDASWIKRILDQIGVQAHAGRDIPLSHELESAQLAISEGAVRAIVREVGDRLDGIIVERCRLEGDVATAEAPVTVVVDVSIYSDANAAETISALRDGVREALTVHTELRLAGIEVRVRDFDKDPEEDE